MRESINLNMNLTKQSVCHLSSTYAVTKAGGSAGTSMNVTNTRVRAGAAVQTNRLEYHAG